MSKIKCPQCGDRDVSITPYTPPDRDVASCYKCGYTSLAENFPRQDLFDRLTASPEVLADKLVYQRNCKMIHQNDKSTMEYWTYSWKSSVITGQSFETKEEAIAATVAKLKEVER